MIRKMGLGLGPLHLVGFLGRAVCIQLAARGGRECRLFCCVDSTARREVMGAF
jgi:hypothetical protein